MLEIKGKYNTAIVFTDNIEQSAVEQITQLCNQIAFKDASIRIMPDVHSGKGCVIGFTADLGEKVVPNLVGVDIGCGLHVVELGDIHIDFESLDYFIQNFVPHGIKIHTDINFNFKTSFIDDVKRISKKTGTSHVKHLLAVGSLGGGNHFIEINTDDSGNKYLVIHSGSRNFGLQVAKYHQKKAEQYCKDKATFIRHVMNKAVGILRSIGKEDLIQQNIYHFKKLMEEYQVPKELMFLEGLDAQEYLEDMAVAQHFAMLNRECMAKMIVQFLGLNYHKLNSWTTVHNYIDMEDRIIRKGAVSAKKGEKVIIPINMRDGSIIAIGKGNENWNNSAPHGAGRVMSRSKAKELLSIDDYKDTMKNVQTWSVNESTLDEAPMAYKTMSEILDNTMETIDILKIIKPLYNFKAN